MKLAAFSVLVLAALLVFGCAGQGAPQPNLPSQPSAPESQQPAGTAPPQAEQQNPPAPPQTHETPASQPATEPNAAPEPPATQTPQAEEAKPHERIVPAFYKGVWMPAAAYGGAQSLEDADDLTDYGINAAALGITVTYDSSGKVTISNPALERQDSRMADMIDSYHKSGIAVMLVPEPMSESGGMSEGPGPVPDEIKEDFLASFEPEMLKWAEFAESRGVEMFAPMNEPDRKLGLARAESWMQGVLPKIREVFSGKVAWKGDLSGTLQDGVKVNFRGYDAIGFTTSPHGGLNIPEYRAQLRNEISGIQEQAQDNGVPEAMITEAWVSSYDGLSESAKAAAFKTVFEEGDGKVAGIFYLDQPTGDPSGTPLKGSEAGEAVKEVFSQ